MTALAAERPTHRAEPVRPPLPHPTKFHPHRSPFPHPAEPAAPSACPCTLVLLLMPPPPRPFPPHPQSPLRRPRRPRRPPRAPRDAGVRLRHGRLGRVLRGSSAARRSLLRPGTAFHFGRESLPRRARRALPSPCASGGARTGSRRRTCCGPSAAAAGARGARLPPRGARGAGELGDGAGRGRGGDTEIVKLARCSARGGSGCGGCGGWRSSGRRTRICGAGRRVRGGELGALAAARVRCARARRTGCRPCCLIYRGTPGQTFDCGCAWVPTASCAPSSIALRENSQNPFYSSPLGRFWGGSRSWCGASGLKRGEVLERLFDDVSRGSRRASGCSSSARRPRVLPRRAELPRSCREPGARGVPARAHRTGRGRHGLHPAAEPAPPRRQDDAHPCDSATAHAASVVVVTGPDSGGKTRLLQAVALTQLLGWRRPASSEPRSWASATAWSRRVLPPELGPVTTTTDACAVRRRQYRRGWASSCRRGGAGSTAG